MLPLPPVPTVRLVRINDLLARRRYWSEPGTFMLSCTVSPCRESPYSAKGDNAVSTEANKDLVHRLWYEELWGKWNTGIADDLFTPNYILHLAGSPDPVARDGTKHVVSMFGAAFPDLTHTVEEMVAEGNTVAARWTIRGTHQGEFQGMAPTGKQVQVTGITIHHLTEGRITESWLVFDTLTVLQQLGAIPIPEQAGA